MDRGYLGLAEILNTCEGCKEVLTQVPFLAASWLPPSRPPPPAQPSDSVPFGRLQPACHDRVGVTPPGTAARPTLWLVIVALDWGPILSPERETRR